MSKATTPGTTLQLPALLADLRLLIILHVSFRLMMLIAYQPLIIDGVERGVSAGGDFFHYLQLSELSKDGAMPFRDWWSEFPPVWSLTTTAIYQFMGQNANYGSWAMLIGLITLVFDVGILLLIRAIGTRLHGINTGITLSWIYTVTFAPLIFVWWTFESLPAFFLLLGVWWLLNGHEKRSAVAAAVGALTKFTPALILGAVWRFRDTRSAVRYTLITLGVFVGVYLLLLVGNPRPEMVWPSLTAQFSKASYQTVWALLDGNYTTGMFGAIESQFDPSQAGVTLGNPAVIPGFVRLAIAAAVGLFVFVRTRRFDEKGLVAFVAITLLIFFIQAQGWSPQWLTQIIPLVLLSFPTRNGILIIVVLSFVTFTEYPLLFLRTGDTGGFISGTLVMPFVLLILSRTAILIGLCVALYQKLRQEPVH